MSDSNQARDDYERGWNDCFKALCGIGLVTDLFYPLSASQRDRIYRKLIDLAEEIGVEIIIPTPATPTDQTAKASPESNAGEGV